MGAGSGSGTLGRGGVVVVWRPGPPNKTEEFTQRAQKGGREADRQKAWCTDCDLSVRENKRMRETQIGASTKIGREGDRRMQREREEKREREREREGRGNGPNVGRGEKKFQDSNFLSITACINMEKSHGSVQTDVKYALHSH